MGAVISQRCPHLREVHLGAFIRPAERGRQQAEHESLHAAVEAQLVPATEFVQFWIRAPSVEVSQLKLNMPTILSY